MKAAFGDLAKAHSDRLSRVGAELHRVQASASSADGQLNACSAELRRQQGEAASLQQRVQTRLSDIQMRVSPLGYLRD